MTAVFRACISCVLLQLAASLRRKSKSARKHLVLQDDSEQVLMNATDVILATEGIKAAAQMEERTGTCPKGRYLGATECRMHNYTRQVVECIGNTDDERVQQGRTYGPLKNGDCRTQHVNRQTGKHECICRALPPTPAPPTPAPWPVVCDEETAFVKNGANGLFCACKSGLKCYENGSLGCTYSKYQTAMPSTLYYLPEYCRGCACRRKSVAVAAAQEEALQQLQQEAAATAAAATAAAAIQQQQQYEAAHTHATAAAGATADDRAGAAGNSTGKQACTDNEVCQARRCAKCRDFPMCFCIKYKSGDQRCAGSCYR